eukprot:scaffold287_cov173-Amphora_coffeaeformis.AAC.5
MGLIGFLRNKTRSPKKRSKKGVQEGEPSTEKGPTILPEPETTEHAEGTNSTEPESSHFDTEAVVKETPSIAVPDKDSESTGKDDTNNDDEGSEDPSDLEGVDDPSFEIVESPEKEGLPLAPIETNESKDDSENNEASILEKFKVKSPPRRGSTVAERAAWLQNSAFKDDKKTEEDLSPGSHEKAKAKKMFWEGKAFQKETSNAPDPPSVRNKMDVQAKKKWLETVAFTPSGGGNMAVEECSPEKRKHTIGLLPASPVQSGSFDKDGKEETKTRTAMDLLKALDSFDKKPLHTDIYLNKEDDPYEWAYEVWFNNGLLLWRSSSFADDDATIHESVRGFLISPTKSWTSSKESSPTRPVNELKQAFIGSDTTPIASNDSKDTGEMATCSMMESETSSVTDAPTVPQSDSLVSEVTEKAEPDSENQSSSNSVPQGADSQDGFSTKAMIDFQIQASTSLETSIAPDDVMKSDDSQTDPALPIEAKENRGPASPSSEKDLSSDFVVCNPFDDAQSSMPADSSADPSVDPNFSSYSVWHERGLIEWNPSDGIPPSRRRDVSFSAPVDDEGVYVDPSEPKQDAFTRETDLGAAGAIDDEEEQSAVESSMSQTDPGHDLSAGFGDPKPPVLPAGPEPDLVASDGSVSGDSQNDLVNVEHEAFGEIWDEDDEELQELFELQQNILEKFRKEESDDLPISDEEVEAGDAPSNQPDEATEHYQGMEDNIEEVSASTDSSEKLQRYGKQYFGSQYTNDSMDFLSVDGDSGVHLEPSVMTHASSITVEESDAIPFADSFDGKTDDSSKDAAASFELMDEMQFHSEMSASSKSRAHVLSWTDDHFGDSRTEIKDQAPAQPSRMVSTEGNFGVQPSTLKQRGERRPSADHAPAQPYRKVSVEGLGLGPFYATGDFSDPGRNDFETSCRSLDHAPAQPMRKISVEGHELVPMPTTDGMSKHDTAPITPVRVKSVDDFSPQRTSDSLRKARAKKIATAIRSQYVMWLAKSRTKTFRKSAEAPILSIFSISIDMKEELAVEDESAPFVLPFLSVPPRLEGKFRPRLQREAPTPLPTGKARARMQEVDNERAKSFGALKQEFREYISPSRRKMQSDALQRFEAAKEQKTKYMRRAFTFRKKE